MAEKDLDEIKGKLYDYEEPVDAELWSDIQDSLRRKRIRRIFYRVASCAAAIAAIFFVFTSTDARKVREFEYFAQLLSSLPVKSFVAENSVRENQIHVLEEVSVPQNGDMYHELQEPDGQDMPVVGTVAGKSSAGKAPHIAQTMKLQSVLHSEKRDEQQNVQQAAQQQTASQDGGQQVENGSVTVNEYTNRHVAQYLYDDWTDEILQTELPRGKRYAIALTGGLMPGSSASVTGQRIMAASAADDMHHGYIIEQVSDTKYSLPVNLGMQMQFPIGENLALGVGVSYTMLRSKFDCLVNKVRYSGSQTLHYVGIPVNVYGMIAQRNNFMFYVNGGAMIEKGVKARYEFSSYNDTYSNSTEMDGLQFSVNAGLGVEYKLASYVGLYFEPNLIYFTNSDMQYCIRTDQPLQIKAELGCRFHF